MAETEQFDLNGHPGVIDLSHNNDHPRFDSGEFYAELYEAGVRLVIHKASQGVGSVDNKYASRRKLVTDNKLLWEAYHFLDSSPPDQQVDHFWHVAELDHKMRGGLDCEINPKGSSFTVRPIQANQAIQILDEKRGYQALRYSGAGYIAPYRIPLMQQFIKGPFWLARYGPEPTAAWLTRIGVNEEDLVLWQETGSGRIAGETPVDLSYFNGTIEQLEEWPELSRFPLVATAEEEAESVS